MSNLDMVEAGSGDFQQRPLTVILKTSELFKSSMLRLFSAMFANCAI